MHPADVEEHINHSLKGLRPPRAPLTLLPRVLAAVQAWAERPWYQRAWFTWPAGWQVASIVALIVLAAGGAVLVPIGLTAARGATAASMAVVTGDVAAFAERVSLAASIVDVLWRSIFAPVLAYAFVLVVLMGLVCGTFALALNRVVFGRTVHS